MSNVVGRVTEVSGSQLIAALDLGGDGDDRSEGAGIGLLVKMVTEAGSVFGTVSEMRTDMSGEGRHLLVIDLLGEVTGLDGAFGRGVSIYPRLGTPVVVASKADGDLVYGRSLIANSRVGSLHQDAERPAFLNIDDLLSKHFAIVGTTGSGKSCAVTLILRAILESHAYAHILLLDPHNEYGAAFGKSAEVINVDNLQLPLWLLNFEELDEVLVRGGSPEEQEAQSAILKEAVVQARRKFIGGGPNAAWITVDTPSPFRISDLVRLIDKAMGILDKTDTSIPYMRLKGRIESLSADRRFNFMFSGVVRDTLGQIIGRLLRMPVNDKPLTIIDLSGVPSEVVDVVVSLVCRLTFDFALWAESEKVPPVLLVCEEAHRYVPADQSLGFAATTRALTRISKEGRKYGISLGLVTQRPAELSPSVLTQCGTLFALRISNEVDQHFVARALPESARGMLMALPSLRRQEALVLGEGVSVPMRIRFDSLAREHQPRSGSANFSKAWRAADVDSKFIADGVRRWRRQLRTGLQFGSSKLVSDKRDFDEEEVVETVLTEVPEVVVLEEETAVVAAASEPVVAEAPESVADEASTPVVAAEPEPEPESVVADLPAPVEAAEAEPVEVDVSRPVLTEVSKSVVTEEPKPGVPRPGLTEMLKTVLSEALKPALPEAPEPIDAEMPEPDLLDAPIPVEDEKVKAEVSQGPEPDLSEATKPDLPDVPAFLISEISRVVLSDPSNFAMPEVNYSVRQKQPKSDFPQVRTKFAHAGMQKVALSGKG